MPFIILSQGSAPVPGFAAFPRQALLERTGAFATFPRYAELSQPVHLSFPRLAQLKRAGAFGTFPRRALVAPPGSPLALLISPPVGSPPPAGGGPAPVPTPAPVQMIPGAAPVQVDVGCVLGSALKFEYEHTGESESATITVRKARSEFPDSLALTVASRGLAQFTTNLEVDRRQWEESTEGGVTTTTVRLYNPTVYLASTKPLPELVPWKLAPRSDTEAKGPPPRQIGVSELVGMAAAAAGVTFSVLGGDPFSGETWMEGRRDTATEGKTFTSVASEVYGATHRLIVRGRALLAVPHGVDIHQAAITESFSPCAVTRMTRRGEAGNVPGTLRLSASDALVPKPPVPKEGPEDSTPESDAKASWLSTSTSDGVTTTTAGYVQGGLLQQTQEVVRGQVIVTETVQPEDIKDYIVNNDSGGLISNWGGFEIIPNYSTPEPGKPATLVSYQVTRTFSAVLIGNTKTDFEYHPENPEALVKQVTLKQSYGYALNTEINPKGVVGTLYSGYISAGDLVSEETETVVQEWYESGELAGYQRRRTATGRRLVSMEQLNAEAPPAERGPLTGKDYVTQVVTDEYRRIGQLWNHTWGTSGGSSVPLFDAESGDAVRLAQKTGTATSGSEVMQNDPPKVNWPKAADGNGNTETDEMQDEVSVPQRMAFSVQGGGLTILQQDFPMLATPAKLPVMAALMAAANGPRIVTELELRSAFSVLPGAAGVTGLHISLDGGKFSSSVTREEVDTPALTPTPWPEPGQGGVSVVSKVAGQEVTMHTLNGTAWKSSKATLPAGVTVAPGTTVAHRLNSQGVNVIVNGVR